ncbi:MAG: Acetyltransferase family protein [Nocardioides sp.]|nr:Acetyltransferase family protein [Nocardioides sp.]
MTAPPAPIVIRRAVPVDAEPLTRLHLDCWDDAYTGLIPQELLDARRTNVPERVDFWRGALEDADPVFLAEGPEGLLGFAGAGPGRDNDVETDLELKVLYVRASHWGTGVGYALFEEAVGDRAAYLWVLANNQRAIHFYERQGFRLDGTEDEHDEGLHVRMLRAGT